MSAHAIRIERIADPRGTMIARKGDGKGGGSGASTTTPHQPVDSPNTLASIATARILEVISEGVVAGISTAAAGGQFWNGVYLNGTPVVDEAGNWQFQLQQGDFRYGYPSQDWIAGYSMSESVFNVGVTTVPFTPVVVQLSEPNVSAVRYVLRVPALYTQMSNGDIDSYNVAYAFDYRIDGGAWTNAVTEAIYGKTMSPYERAVRVQLPTATSYIEIRVERIQSPSIGGSVGEIIFSTYTEIVDGQLAYDDTCVMAMTVNAAQFSSIPQRGYLLDGIMVDLPTSYNGRTHGDSGNWDGTFYTQWTNNPAWILYALLVNTRWGLGRDLDPSLIDKWSFYEAQQYNDGSVPKAGVGSEVRFTCNCVINTEQDAWTVLTAVASSMLATLYYANGTVFLVQDRPQYTPLRLFGPADVVSGLFDYMGTDYRSRFTAAAITWNDPEDSYKPSVELVLDQTLVAQQGYRETKQTAFGCTSRGQAHRLGRWLIYTSQYETEMVTFTVGLENADVRPGDYILISDPSTVGARLAGRLLDDQGVDTITLDQSPAQLADGAAWSIYITIGSANVPDGTNPPQVVAPRAVLAVLPNNQLRIDQKPGGAVAGCMWLAQSGEVVPTPWRVATLTDKGNGQYEVLASEFHSEKFNYVDYGWTTPPPSFSLIPTGPLINATDLTDTEYIYLDGNGWPQFGVTLSWSASRDPRVSYYMIEMSGPHGDYRRFNQVTGVAWDVPLMREGTWTVQLRAFDNIGRASLRLVYTFVPIGLRKPPQPPSALYITPQGGNLTTLTWTPTGEINVVAYWVRWSPLTSSGATWSAAVTSIASVDRNTTQVSTPTRAGTFMVKAINADGIESQTWAEAILQPQQTETSIFFNEAEQPTWGGTLDANWHHNGAELWIIPPSAPEPVPPGTFPGERNTMLNQTPTRVAVYGFLNTFDLGAPTLVTMTGIVAGYGDYGLGVMMVKWVPLASATPLAQGANYAMSGWVPLAAAVPIGKNQSSQWDAHIEMQVSQDAVTYAGWVPLKSTVVTGRAFKWRLVGTLYDLQTVLRATQASVLIEVPLRSVQGVDVPLDATTGQLIVTYVAPFLVTPTVQLTARESVAPGGDILIALSDRNHFVVQGVDASGANHGGGAIDYFVQGYGGHS